MKRIFVLCSVLMLTATLSANAQGAVDRLLGKIDKASDKADKAAATADRAGKTGNKLGGLFGKKKNAEASAETKTTINVSGATFASLKSLNESVQASKGVASTKMKFSSSGSTIVVQHAGSTEDLLKALQRVSPTVFSEKNLEGLDNGEISVKIK